MTAADHPVSDLPATAQPSPSSPARPAGSGEGVDPAVIALAKVLTKANGHRNWRGAIEYDIPAMVAAVRAADLPDATRAKAEALREVKRDVLALQRPSPERGIPGSLEKACYALAAAVIEDRADRIERGDT